MYGLAKKEIKWNIKGCHFKRLSRRSGSRDISLLSYSKGQSGTIVGVFKVMYVLDRGKPGINIRVESIL